MPEVERPEAFKATATPRLRAWRAYGRVPSMAVPVQIPEDWTDREAVEAWLGAQPRAVSVALAARAALRVLPLVALKLDMNALKKRRTIMLPVFRMVAPPWLAAARSSPDAAEQVRAAAASAADSPTAAFSDGTASAASSTCAAYAARAASAGSAASAAAASVAAAASFAAAATEADAAFAVSAADPETLAQQPLWTDTPPEWAQRLWSPLRHQLLAADEGWEVWTTWYEARLRGDPVDVELETRRVIEPTRWADGPAAVNAEIAAIITDHEARKQGTRQSKESPQAPPDLPEPRLAPVTFAFRDGAIHREPALPPDPPQDQAPALRSAWTALHQSLTDLIEDDPGREVQLGRTLRRCLAALGEDAGSVDVILLGGHARTLSGIAHRADEILLPEIAAQVVSLDAALSIYLAWFPSWAAYAGAMAQPMADPVNEQAAVGHAEEVIAAINEAAPDLVAPDAQEPLSILADAATPSPSPDDPAPVAPAQARRGFLRAARDLLLKLSGAVIEDLGAGARKGVQKFTETQTVAALGAAAAYLAALAAAVPAEFQWLVPVIAYLKLMTNRP